jgi:excisionase family DNA binding protein
VAVEPSPLSADSLLTVDDIARTLKLNPQTVRNWIDQGYLRAIRIGRNVRVTHAEFDRLIEESYIGSKPVARSNAAQAFWDGELLPQVELP